jgi:isochorismate synthase
MTPSLAPRSIHDQLRAGLVRVRDGLTAIAMPAPRGPAAGLLALDGPAVLWAARDVEDVTAGIGAAVEIRAAGARRFAAVMEAAWGVAPSAAVIGGRPADPRELAALGIAPRFIGGFAFGPGATWPDFPDAWFALPRLTYRCTADRAWLVLIASVTDAPDDCHALVDRALDALRAPVPRGGATTVAIDAAGRTAWLAEVAAARGAIAANQLAKVVLARSTPARGRIEPAAVVAALDDRHPECTRFAIRPRGGGATFVGATPERLIQRVGRAIASEALAGSIARTTDDRADAARLLASGKDRGEHAIVVDAIAAALGARCSALSVPPTPAVRTLRHVHHLRTTIAGTLRGSDHVVELASALHPTPAVGGWPTPAALAFIAAHEPAPRGWYGAPVGWFDASGDGELVVAIRSALLDGDRADVWAGAGIVADSEPIAEWDETWIKQRAVLGALGAEP